MYKLALLLFLFSPFSLLAALCEVKSGSVTVGGNNYAAKEQIVDCTDDIKANSEGTELCRLNKLGQWKCNPLPVGDNSSGQLVAQLQINEQYNDSFWSTLKGIFTPDKKAEYGGKRLKESVYLQGFPNGIILKPDSMLTLSTRFSLNLPISEFNLVDTKTSKIIYSGRPASTEVTFDGQPLQPGGVYQWSMEVEGQPYEGEFSIAEQIDQQEFEQELAEACNANKLNGTAIQIMRAAIVKDYGYTFDYFMAREAVRSQVLTNH